MADQNKKVSFSAQDNGISSFMKKLQQDSKQLFGEFSKEAEKQTKSQKERLKLIEQQIAALKRQNDLEKEQNRIILERKRQAGNLSDKDYKAGFAQIKGDDSVNKAQILLLKEMLANLKAGQKDEKPKSSSVFSAVLAANIVSDILKGFTQTANAQNGMDLVPGMFGKAGALAGLPFGATGVAIGQSTMGFLGNAVARSFNIRDQYDQAYNKYRALGGRESSSNLSGMGFDDIAVANTMAQTSLAAGMTRGASRNTLATLGLNRGFGIDQGTSLAALSAARFGGGNGTNNMMKILGISIGEGLDRTKFGDAIKAQTQLLQHFSSTSNVVNPNDANRTLFEFNRMGGMFRLGDPRSMGNILGVNEGLSNPGSAFGQAQNYSVLRRLNPNASLFDLKKMEEQGLQTPGFLQGVMDQIGGTGVSTDLQKFMLKGRFNNLSYEAIDTLFNGKGNIDSMTAKELSRSSSLSSVQGQAEELTSRYTKMNAEVTNAFRTDFIAGISTVAKQFEGEMGRAVKEVGAQLSKELEQLPQKAKEIGENLLAGTLEAIDKRMPHDPKIDSAYMRANGYVPLPNGKWVNKYSPLYPKGK